MEVFLLLHIHKELSGTNLTCLSLGSMNQFSQGLILSLNEVMASSGQH